MPSQAFSMSPMSGLHSLWIGIFLFQNIKLKYCNRLSFLCSSPKITIVIQWHLFSTSLWVKNLSLANTAVKWIPERARVSFQITLNHCFWWALMAGPSNRPSLAELAVAFCFSCNWTNVILKWPLYREEKYLRPHLITAHELTAQHCSLLTAHHCSWAQSTTLLTAHSRTLLTAQCSQSKTALITNHPSKRHLHHNWLRNANTTRKCDLRMIING